MVLRGFAVHPDLRSSLEARTAGDLLKSRLFKPDAYSSYQAARYWVRFVHWWPNLLTAMESLSLLDLSAADDDIRRGLDWFLANQRDDGLWDTDYNTPGSGQSNQTTEDRAWITLRICRVLKRLAHHTTDNRNTLRSGTRRPA